MKLLTFRLIALLAQFAVAICVLEILLRAYPTVISAPLLTHFPVPLRHHIAERLNYPSVNQFKIIPSNKREDGGPPIYHPAPNTVLAGLVDKADAKAGAVITGRADARGFCNPPEKGTREHADIVVLGDSFTACTTIAAEYTSTNYLAKITDYTTYNLGVGNIGPHEYIELLRLYGLGLSPRIVIMNIYEGNDIRDAVRYLKFLSTGRDRRESDNTIQRLVSKSYAVSLIYAAKELLGKDQVQWLFDDERRINYRYTVHSQGSRVGLNVTNHDRGEVRDAGRLANKTINLDIWLPPLLAFKNLSQSHNFIPIISYTPTAHTAYLDSVQFEDSAVGDLVRKMSEQQRSWLRQKSSQLGIMFIDLIPSFQEAVRKGPLTHFPANVHLTPYGHQVSATQWSAIITPLLSTTPSTGIVPARFKREEKSKD